jgi:hypothetical protein
MTEPPDERSPRERLLDANIAVGSAALMLIGERETIEAFLRECRDNLERREIASAMRPIYEAALGFLSAYERESRRLGAVLEGRR